MFLDTTTQSLLREQNEAFNSYENEISMLKARIADLTEQSNFCRQQLANQLQQIEVKNRAYQMLKNSFNELKNENNTFKTQIDDLNMKLLEAITSKEESERHNKQIIIGLQKTAANAEEASQYMRRLNKMFQDYSNGEKYEDTLACTTRMCAICMTEPANVVAKPCQHLEWCSSCAVDVFGLKENQFTLDKTVYVNHSSCPRCKTDVECVDYIYC